MYMHMSWRWSLRYGLSREVQVPPDREAVHGSAAVLVDHVQHCRRVKGYSHRHKRKQHAMTRYTVRVLEKSLFVDKCGLWKFVGVTSL